MLKVDIPEQAPSIWKRIIELRTNDVNKLAPKMKQAVLEFEGRLAEVDHIVVCRSGRPLEITFDPIRFETARADELQKIYYQQGTTNAPTAIYGWHFFGLASDYISKSRGWSVPAEWWAKMADIAEASGLASGYRWNSKDEPHVYLKGIKKSPSDATREAYFNTKNWLGLPVLSGQAHLDGLMRVWKITGAV